jgi:hypothetical protein
VLTGELPSAPYTNIRPTTSATQHTRHQTCALRELRMKVVDGAAHQGG